MNTIIDTTKQSLFYSYHLTLSVNVSNNATILALQTDEFVGIFRQIGNGDPTALLDKLGHRLKFVLRDVDKLSSVVKNTSEFALV